MTTTGAQQFRLADVAPASVMQAALAVAHRSHEAGRPSLIDDITRATGLGPQQARNAIDVAVQLRLVQGDTSTGFGYIGPDDIRAVPKDFLPDLFRRAAQQYPPFLLFVAQRSRNFTVEEASRFVASTFGIGLAPERIATIFSRWANWAGITRDDGTLDFQPREVTDFGFLARLSESLRAELATKTFVMNELGHGFWADLYSMNLDADALSRALTTHETAPKAALQDAGNLLEGYLAQLALPAGGPLINIAELGDFLAGKNAAQLLRTHRNLTHGAAAYRNAADHGSDPDTGAPWAITKEAGLVGTLHIMLTMRSINRWLTAKRQEL